MAVPACVDAGGEIIIFYYDPLYRSMYKCICIYNVHVYTTAHDHILFTLALCVHVGVGEIVSKLLSHVCFVRCIMVLTC